MSEMTLFLSQLIGPIVLLMGLSFWVNRSFYMDLFKKLENNSAFIFFDGLVEPTVGLAIVLNHNYWGNLNEVIITLFGWLMLFEGALILLGTKASVKAAMKSMSKSMDSLLSGMSVACVLIGAYLAWMGYLV